MEKPERPTLSDLKRDWNNVITNTNFLTTKAVHAGQSFFKDRVDSLRFAILVLHHETGRLHGALQRKTAEYNESVKLGSEIIDQRDRLMEDVDLLVKAIRMPLWHWKRRRLLLDALHDVSANLSQIRMEESDELITDAGGIPGGDGMGVLPPGGVDQTVPEAAVVDPEEGAADAPDLPDTGERVPELAADASR